MTTPTAAVTTNVVDIPSNPWIELNEPKHLSRLLYANPVCFLSICTPECRNVMVLSWMTATNNEGRFVFSINRRRHTASLLIPEAVFVLSVPVKGMEQLVRDVGGTSGRWGSKFCEDHLGSAGGDSLRSQHDQSQLSKRQFKKQKQRLLGVAGLSAVSCGMRQEGDSNYFAVDGTVAHLQCRVNCMINENTLVDDDHFLVSGEISRAFVHASYWDSTKKLFRPIDQSPPYLTFFGSQTFGYVVTG